MWFVAIALVSIVGSLVFGRLLARASAEQTFNPHPIRGPSREPGLESHRLEVAAKAAQRRVEVHLN